MRNSNWKAKLIVVIAFVLGIAGGFFCASLVPSVWKGLVGFGVFIVLVLGVTFVLTKVLQEN